MMKRILSIFALLGAAGVSVLAQNSISTRPRVAPTPTQAPPVIQNDTPATDRRGGPPVLGGDHRQRPVPTQTPKAGDDSPDIIKIETNLITMPVSVLDREGRFVSGLVQ
jgi:hypothetical protein